MRLSYATMVSMGLCLWVAEVHDADKIGHTAHFGDIFSGGVVPGRVVGVGAEHETVHW